MTWIMIIGGGLAAIVAAVAGIGAMIPREHRAARQAVFAKASPEQVWQLIAGPQDWRTDIAKWERIDDTHFVEIDKRGQRMPAVLVESVEFKKRVTRIDDASLPFGGTWTWELTPQSGGGCALRITEDGFVNNVIFRFVSRFVMGHHATMESYLKNLATKLGEPGTPIQE